MTSPFSERTSSSGVAPTRPSTLNVQHDGYCVGEPLERPPHVDGVLGARVHVAREHHLLHVAGPDGRDAPGDDVAPAVRAHGAVGVDDRRRGRSGGTRGPTTSLSCGAARSRAPVVIVVSQVRPAAAADHDAGDDDDAAGGGVVVERERAERHRPGPGHLHLVADDRVARAPPATPARRRRTGPAPATSIAQGLAPRDQPVAAAHPRQRRCRSAGGRGGRAGRAAVALRRAEVVEGDRADHERVRDRRPRGRRAACSSLPA